MGNKGGAPNYQKSTFKFINDDEYERRQLQAQKAAAMDRDEPKRRIVLQESPKDENSMSDDSMKEPQEELA